MCVTILGPLVHDTQCMEICSIKSSIFQANIGFFWKGSLGSIAYNCLTTQQTSLYLVSLEFSSFERMWGTWWQCQATAAVIQIAYTIEQHVFSSEKLQTLVHMFINTLGRMYCPWWQYHESAILFSHRIQMQPTSQNWTIVLERSCTCTGLFLYDQPDISWEEVFSFPNELVCLSMKSCFWEIREKGKNYTTHEFVILANKNKSIHSIRSLSKEQLSKCALCSNKIKCTFKTFLIWMKFFLTCQYMLK
jgi:hypothetical protein